MNNIASRLACIVLVSAFTFGLSAQGLPVTTERHLAQASDLEGSDADLSKAVESNPEEAQDYYRRGAMKHRDGDAEGGRLDREKAVALDPGGDYPPYPAPEPTWHFLLWAIGLFGSLVILIVELGMIFARRYIVTGPNVAEIWGVSPDDLRRLPASFVHRGDLNEGSKIRAIASGWGLAGITASLLGTVYHWQAGNRDIGQLFLFLLLALIVATPLAYRRGGRISGAARRLAVTPDGVSVSVPEGGYGESWSEPLAGYAGVLGEKEGRGSGDDTYSVAVFQLVHPQSEKTLRLYELRARLEDAVEADPEARCTWEAFAEVLGVPALTKTEEGFVAREPEDLSKPVGELVREGKVDVAFDADLPIPDGLKVEAEGDATVVTVYAMPLPQYLKALGMALGLGLMISGIWFRSPLGAILGLGFFALTRYWRLHNARIRITHDAISLTSIGPKREVVLVTLKPAEVEDVKVTRGYPSDFTVWRSAPSSSRIILEAEYVMIFFAEIVRILLENSLPIPTRTVADRGYAEGRGYATAPDPSAPAAEDESAAPFQARALQLVTDRAAYPVPVRMSSEAAEWLRGLILSLLASDAGAPPP